MLSEIEQKLGALEGPRVAFDEVTQTNIGYSTDGLWMSFDSQSALEIKVQYVKRHNLVCFARYCG